VIKTWVFIFFSAAILVSVDVYLYTDNIPGNSISQVIISAAEQSMLIPWFVGFVMGALTFHWFDNYKE